MEKKMEPTIMGVGLGFRVLGFRALGFRRNGNENGTYYHGLRVQVFRVVRNGKETIRVHSFIPS